VFLQANALVDIKACFCVLLTSKRASVSCWLPLLLCHVGRESSAGCLLSANNNKEQTNSVTLSPQENNTDRAAEFVAEISANFGVFMGVDWSAQWVLTAINLDFVYRSLHFFS
jgi:hypothetical protein